VNRRGSRGAGFSNAAVDATLIDLDKPFALRVVPDVERIRAGVTAPFTFLDQGVELRFTSIADTEPTVVWSDAP